MTEGTFTSSGYSIESAKIFPYGTEVTGRRDAGFFNISEQIVGITFTQSISNVSYSGVINVVDSVGLLERAPLRGEEFLELKLRTYDTGTNLTLRLQVYKITDVELSNNATVYSYNLHVVSKTTYDSSKRLITSSFKGSSNQIAKEIFSEYYTSVGGASSLDENNKTLPYASKKYKIQSDSPRELTIQPGEGIQKIIVPRYRPAKALSFLAERSYTSETSSFTFRFFETFAGYFFVTDEYLLKRGETRNDIEEKNIKLFYSPIGSNDPRYPEDMIGRVEQISNPVRIDTAGDLILGGYKNSVYEIDLVRRAATLKKYDYLKDGSKYIDASGQERKTQNMPHTSDFIEETFTDENSKRFMVFRDYQQPGDIPGPLRTEQHFAEMLMHRNAYNHHLNALSVLASMKGRLDITPGRIVDLDVRNVDVNQSAKNEQMSGRYLVHTVNHNFKGDELNTTMKLSKFDWSK